MIRAGQTADRYARRRAELEVYFDRTAVDGWKKLVGTEKVSRIRETVRAGRDAMRARILDRFPEDLSGWRILDAGCGSGVMSFALAARGADVTGVDLSPQMIGFAADSAGSWKTRHPGAGTVTFEAGDMLSAELGQFDAVVAMDSLIHYHMADAADAVAGLARRTARQIVFTVAPRTPLLSAMHAAGKLFPRSDRSPAIEPVVPARIIRLLAARPDMAGWTASDTARVSSGFYISEALEVKRA